MRPVKKVNGKVASKARLANNFSTGLEGVPLFDGDLKLGKNLKVQVRGCACSSASEGPNKRCGSWYPKAGLGLSGNMISRLSLCDSPTLQTPVNTRGSKKLLRRLKRMP